MNPIGLAMLPLGAAVFLVGVLHRRDRVGGQARGSHASGAVLAISAPAGDGLGGWDVALVLLGCVALLVLLYGAVAWLGASGLLTGLLGPDGGSRDETELLGAEDTRAPGGVGIGESSTHPVEAGGPQET